MGTIDEEKHARAIVAAEQLKLLFVFAGQLIPDIDLLEEVYIQSSDRESHTMALAPVLTAVGVDYEEEHFEAALHRRRAVAVLDLVKVLRDTEAERAEFKLKQANKQKIAAQLRRVL